MLKHTHSSATSALPYEQRTMHVAAVGATAAAAPATGGTARVSSTDSTAAAITRRLHAEAAALYHRSPAVSPSRFGSSLSTAGLINGSSYGTSNSTSSSTSSSRSASPLPGSASMPFDPSVCAPFLDLASLESHIRLTVMALDKAKRRFILQFGTLSAIAVGCSTHALWDQFRDSSTDEDPLGAASSSSASVLLLLACIVILLLYVASGTWVDRMTGSATYILACNRWMSLFGVQWDTARAKIVIEELPVLEDTQRPAAQGVSGRRNASGGMLLSRRRASGGSIASSVSSASTLMRLLHEPDAEYEARKRSGIASGWINESPLAKSSRTIAPIVVAPPAAAPVPVVGVVPTRASLSEPSTPCPSSTPAVVVVSPQPLQPPQPLTPPILHSPAHAHAAAPAADAAHHDHLTVPPTLSSAVAALIRSASNPALAAAAAAASAVSPSAAAVAASPSVPLGSPADIHTLTSRDAKFLHSSIFSPDLSPGSADEAEVVLLSPAALSARVGGGGGGSAAMDDTEAPLPPPKDERERVMQQIIRRSKSMENAMAALEEQERAQKLKKQQQQTEAEEDEDEAEPDETEDAAEPEKEAEAEVKQA